MTRKADKDFVPEVETEGVADAVGHVDSYELETGGISSDFNVEDEYKPTPLIPNGWYSGAITENKLDTEQQCIVFVSALADNGGLMSDGETEIDGTTMDFRIWLPRPGDENELTKNGKQTKRQAKINMMRDAGTKLKIELNKPIDILTAIRNQDWVGLAVKLKITASEYEGRVRNQVADFKAV